MKHTLLACLALAVTADATSYKLVNVRFDPPENYPAGDVVLHLMLFPFTEVCLLCERNRGSCNVTTDVSGLQPASMLVSTDPSVRGIESHVNVVGWLRSSTYTCSRQPTSLRSRSGFGGVAGVFGEGAVSISRGWHTPLYNAEEAFDGVKLTFERDTTSATALEHVGEDNSGHTSLTHELDVLISNITVAAIGRRSGAITFAYGGFRLTKCFACNGTTSHQGCYLIGTDFAGGSEYFKTVVSGMKVWYSEWTRPSLSTGVPTQTLCKPSIGGYPVPTSAVHEFGGFEVYNMKRLTLGSFTVTVSTQKVWVPGTVLSLSGEPGGVTDPEVLILEVLLPTGCLIMICVVCCLRRARRNADDSGDSEAVEEEPPRPSQEQWVTADTADTAAAAPEPEVIIPPRQLSALPIGFGEVRFPEPQHMVCPISLQLMRDPVSCGCQHKHVYERACLEAHVMKNGRCPMTREEMTMQDIKSHAALKVEIEEYVATQRSLE